LTISFDEYANGRWDESLATSELTRSVLLDAGCIFWPDAAGHS
jgi:hypothetical protein